MCSSYACFKFKIVQQGALNMTLRISSVFKDELMAYRELQLATGIKEVSIERFMNYFDDFARENNIQEIEFTHEMSLKWYSYRKEQGEFTRYVRILWSLHFLTYLKSKGYNVYISRLPKNVVTKFQAYIYSEDEIKRYFEKIDTYYSSRDPFIELCLPVIFRILYCCGTRVGETLSLKVKDVDLKNGILYLNETKNKKKRMVVIGDDLKYLLNQYGDKCLYLKSDNEYFFSCKTGKRIDEQTIYNFHRKALEDCEIPYFGGGKGPRLHDWRHTFTVTSFSNFIDDGYDFYNVLPILSQYLGHNSIASTEKYLKLVTQHFEEVISKSEETTKYILQENNDEK